MSPAVSCSADASRNSNCLAPSSCHMTLSHSSVCHPKAWDSGEEMYAVADTGRSASCAVFSTSEANTLLHLSRRCSTNVLVWTSLLTSSLAEGYTRSRGEENDSDRLPR